jgi:hypothetical protein
MGIVQNGDAAIPRDCTPIGTIIASEGMLHVSFSLNGVI